MRRRIAVVVTIVLLTACGGGGPSDKDQASKVAIAYRRAGNEHDYVAKWKLSQPNSYPRQSPSAEEYAADETKQNGPPGPGAEDLLYTTEVVTKEGDFYRVRVRVTDPSDTEDVKRSDVIVGQYDGQWLVAGSVEPGYPITPEDVE